MIGMTVATKAAYYILREFMEPRGDSSVRCQTKTSSKHETIEDSATTSIDKETTIHLQKASSNHKQVRRRTVGAQSM
eukprot:4095042-Pyramimonas_sp.AAC.1